MVMNICLLIFLLRLIVRAQECEKHMSFSLWFIWSGSFIKGWIEFGWNWDEKKFGFGWRSLNIYTWYGVDVEVLLVLFLC
jgi:hypothetical protein